MSERRTVALAGLAFAMGLKTGRCDPADVVGLIERAGCLPEDDALRIAIRGSCIRLWGTRSHHWEEIGADLHHRIEVALMPVPPDGGRRDIHG